MPVLPIPAIDLMDGQVVRLSRGEARAKTVYSDDPAAMARQFEAAGARRLHVVDLDGAFGGASANLKAIQAIRRATSMQIELGGGLRTMEAVELVLAMGIDGAILGTAALRDRGLVERLAERFGPRLIVGIDARDGMVAVEGWVETSTVSALDFARRMEGLGVGCVIATDVATDGMLSGPNLEFYRQLAEAAPGLDLIASGGVRDLADLEALDALGLPRLIGAISGRAIYEKTLDLAEAIRRLSR
jgi:phosphoribosylformimino-5-aminoimidazole carboxamide ribotide isomerase